MCVMHLLFGVFLESVLQGMVRVNVLYSEARDDTLEEVDLMLRLEMTPSKR